jgi:hypothetical protein
MTNFDEKDLLARELRERAADVDGHPIGFDAVRQSARKIRRRRNMVTGAVAAVVASISLPTGVAITAALDGPDGRTDDQMVATNPAPDLAGPAKLTLEGLPRGEDPAIAYFHKGTVVTPERTFELDTTLQALVRRADGWIGLGYAGNGAEVYHLDESLEVTGSEPSGQTMASNDDGSLVAYVRIEPDGSQTLLSAAELDALSWTFPERPAVEPVGYVGPGDVVYQTFQGERSTAGIARGDGTTEPLQGFVGLSSASDTAGLIAGQTRVNDDGSGCFGVMDPGSSTKEMVWSTCAYSLNTFSPDGKWLLAGPAYGDGQGDRELYILDARTGAPVMEYTQPRDGQVALMATAWESDETVLSVATEGMTTTVLRMSLDGRLEDAVEPAQGDPFADMPFWFSQTLL